MSLAEKNLANDHSRHFVPKCAEIADNFLDRKPLVEVKLAVISADTTDHGKREATSSSASVDEPPPEILDLRREEDRLKTYVSWPVIFVDRNRLARTGFYYLGVEDKVRCYFCRVELGHWEEGDDPIVDHERWSPLCPLLRGRAITNVPLISNNESSLTFDNASQDVCGMRDRSSDGPQRPAYALETARIQSFADWPCRMKQTAATMADAGFFYTGSGDKTVCYYCGGGLKDWEDNDDPWEQHARWFPSCHYVRLVKGESFVQKVRAHPVKMTQFNPKDPPTSVATQLTQPLGVDRSTEENIEKVEESNNVCKLCFTGERNICFVPCGHVVACPKCALSIQKCPVCRKQFTSTMRLYYS